MSSPGSGRRRLPLFLRGLHTSVDGNSHAFGFSITITVTFGVVSADQPQHPTTLELVGFALSAVAAFSLLNLVVAWLVPDTPREQQPGRVVLVATATDVLAVGASVASALAVRWALTGWGAWVLAPFCASMVYVLVQAVELTVGQWGDEQADDGSGDETDGDDDVGSGDG